MSILDENVVDVYGIETCTGRIILTISDHLQWDNTYDHITKLQNKINAYLSFIESGQINELTKGDLCTGIVIRIVFKHNPDPECISFLKKVRIILESNNYEIDWKVLD